MPNKFPLPRINNKPAEAEEKIDLQDLFCAFEDCHDRYNECLEYRNANSSYDLQEALENYILDFELAARSTLGARSERFDLFRMVFLEGRSTVECCELLGLDNDTFTRESDHIKAAVGSELMTRGMFPLQRYFGSSLSRRPSVSASRQRLAA